MFPAGIQTGLFSAALLFCAVRCDVEHPGEEPPRGKLYYPTAIAISEQGPGSTGGQGQPAQYLFAANTNFDLAYNAGSVQAFDLQELDSEIAKCDGSGDCVIDPSQVLVGEVLIGSYAVDIALSASADRIYVPIRSDSALTYVDVRPGGGSDDILECGQGSDRRCGANNVRGDVPVSSARGDIEMPSEPIGLISGPLTDFDPQAAKGEQYVIVAHRTGALSLFVDHLQQDDGPVLADVEKEGLFQRTTGIGFDSHTSLVYLTSNDISNSVQHKYLDRVGVAFTGEDPFLFNAGPLRLTGVSRDRDTRDIGFDPDRLPGEALVVARVPSSLIVAATGSGDGEGNEALASTVTEVGAGASRLSLGRIGNGEKLFAFVSCFDARSLFIIDTEWGEPVAVVRGFSGPFDMVLDRWRERIYVADFRSSSIRIVDLKPLVCRRSDTETECADVQDRPGEEIPCRCLDSSEIRITATLGEPSLPAELI